MTVSVHDLSTVPLAFRARTVTVCMLSTGPGFAQVTPPVFGSRIMPAAVLFGSVSVQAIGVVPCVNTGVLA